MGTKKAVPCRQNLAGACAAELGHRLSINVMEKIT